MQKRAAEFSRGRVRSGRAKRCAPLFAATALAAFVCSFAATAFSQTIPTGLSQIEHIIVIYQENRSFDFLFGDFPGANGIPADPPKQLQFSNDPSDPYSDGTAYDTLPRPYTRLFFIAGPNVPDLRFPDNLPNRPFLQDDYISPWSINPLGSQTGDPVHRFYQCIGQINGGRMDKFVAWASRDWPGEDKANALPYSHTRAVDHPLGQLGREYVLCDNFFQSMYGASAPNHFFLVAARTLHWAEGLKDPRMRVSGGIVKLNAQGFPASKEDDGWLSPEGWVVNNPQDSGPAWRWTAERWLPPVGTQTIPTIGDRLEEKGVTWKWYAQYQSIMPGVGAAVELNDRVRQLVVSRLKAVPSAGLADEAATDLLRMLSDRNAIDGLATLLVQGWYIVQPFRYFAKYANGTSGAAEHLVDLTEFDTDVANGTLPAVSFIKHYLPDDEHPGDSDLILGQQRVLEIVNKVKASAAWDRSVIIITYDENGGFWDHVAPPPARPDAMGPGPRVPCVVVSPLAKRGFVDSTPYETISILRLIELRFGLTPVNEVSAAAQPLLGWLR